mgnify:CR=1 FL=1
MPIVNDTIAETAAPVSSSIKEGMENENPDADSKEIIDRNLTSINANDSQSKFKLRDYYIKAAYNAFNPDKFKNSNVSMDALMYVIARGCRFIDFEVFSVENQPVIASSSVNSFNYKENSVKLNKNERIRLLEILKNNSNLEKLSFSQINSRS